MKKLLIYYSFIVVSAMVLMGFIGASSFPQLLSAILFYPLAMYFGIYIVPKRARAISLPKATRPLKAAKEEKSKEGVKKDGKEGDVVQLKKEDEEKVFDIDRRAFIKLIGSAGMSLFLLSIFTKKAQGAFFGSQPGPGTVSIKNIAGEKIDPAERHPTDGYRIAEVDDSTPSYYGFVDKNGYYFLIRDDDGTYKYVTGTSGFSTAWTGRGSIPEIDWKYYDEAF
jgi:hypothetical protein